jgi:predicted transposase YbfD/YdcC
MRYAEQVNLGHGRIEKRRLWALPIYDDFLDWPGARLMLRLERTRIHKASGQRTTELAYALTSLSLDEATPQQLLTLWRGHWQIENRLHYVRDVTMGEDACRIRSGQAPQALAAARNTVLAVLRLTGCPNVAEALRAFAQNPYRALGQFVLL